jgi:hypothetical protein
VARKGRIAVDVLDPNRVDVVYGVLKIDFGDKTIQQDPDGLIFLRANSLAYGRHMRHQIAETLERCEWQMPWARSGPSTGTSGRTHGS